MTSVMMTTKNLPKRFWVEVVKIICYSTNRVYLRPGIPKIAY